MAEPGARTWTTRLTYGVFGCALASMAVLPPTYQALTGPALVLVLAQNRLRFGFFERMPGGLTVRRVLRTGLFFVPVVFLGPPSFAIGLESAVLAVALALPPLAVNARTLRLALDEDLIGLLPPLTPAQKWRDAFHHTVSGPAQEYLHRFCVSTALAPVLGLFVILAGAATFALDHLSQKQPASSGWTRRDHLVHAYISISGGVLTYFLHSWLAAALLHTLYNLPNVFQVLRRRTWRSVEGVA